MEWLSPEGICSFLCAALLHDLGHFPYAHSLKELPLESHEALTAKIILQEPLKTLTGRAGADPCFTAAIVDTALPDRENGELRFYRKLLSGVLDPDKLDYLNRDARFCGVPYGAQDVDFILSRLHPHRERGVTVDSRGIPSVESVLFSKYLMYRTVYWHHSVRSATAMIKKALLGGLRDGTIIKDELYGLDDQGLFSLMAERSHPLFVLAEKVRGGTFYTAAAEFPFDGNVHGRLLDIENRFRYEAALAEEFSGALGAAFAPEDLIIDVPEPVGFETGLYVEDEGRCFSECSSIFKAEDVFVQSLRVIRVFTDPALEKPLKNLGKLEEILHIRKKWLHLG
jgi:hypothetical protein